MLTRGVSPLIGKPGQSSAPVGRRLNQHANECVGHLVTHSVVQDARHGVPIDRKALVEAFPTSFLGMMIEEPKRLVARRGDRSDIFFQHLVTTGVLHSLIEHCLPGRQLAQDLRNVVNHDDRAAVICAISALCVAMGDFVAVGDDDGWIILPPRRFIQWALLPQVYPFLNRIAFGSVSYRIEPTLLPGRSDHNAFSFVRRPVIWKRLARR
ncbi:hypothetical protein MES5069_680078 [Mesorhizobium escarrei]|uniref:Uncharacterized protein n=1 Tax=Mesorhizobium escarrei TaxID=666018 RepID=A0ABM9EG79_9HYPH|nr:hypothetical protein MES5069_680078 [Mesorhizobium escarrei]